MADDVESPTLQKLEAWTREYYESVRKQRIVEGKSFDATLATYDWFCDEYVLTGPDIGPLSKKDYLATQRGFTLNFSAAAPDLNYLLDGFHVDPDMPWRVWFTLRYVGTHTGSTRISKFELNPKGGVIKGGPEMHSILWTPQKQIKWETVGYVGCKYTGSNQGFGGLAGLLLPLGVPRFLFDAIAASGLAKLLFFLS